METKPRPRKDVIVQPATTPLREVASVPFSSGAFLAWMGAPLCDASGNVFLAVMMPDKSGRLEPSPRQVLAVSADGKTQTRFVLSSVPGAAEADQVTMGGAALDSAGRLFVLVWLRKGESGRQYVVSFDKDGKYRSRVEIDQEEMHAQQLEVFGSGDFLLFGRRFQPDGERLAILPASGGAMRDVAAAPVQEIADPDVPPSPTLKHAVRGGEGRIYFSNGSGTIYALDPSGDCQPALQHTLKRGRQLVDIKIAGQHLAATYYDERATKNKYRTTVYDLTFGEKTADYGPLPAGPVCYGHGDSGDRFTLLSNANRLVTMTP